MKNIFVSCLLLLCFRSNAQDQRAIDSLLALLQTEKQDTARVNHLNELCYLYGASDLKQALQYADQALTLAQKINWREGIAVSSRYKGTVYLEMGDRKNALPFYKLSVKESEAVNDIEGVVLGYYNLGNIHQHESQFVEAGDYFFKGIKLAETHKHEGLTGQGNYYAAVLFAQQNDYKKSNTYASKALAVTRKLNDFYYQGAILEILGYSYVKQHLYPEAIGSFEDALKAYDSIHHDLGKAKIYSQLVECYPEEPMRQLHYLDLSDSIWMALGAHNSVNAVNNIANRGLIYYWLLTKPESRHDSLGLTESQLRSLSREYLKKGIALGEQNGYQEMMIQHYQFYADILANDKDYKNALAYYKKFVTLKDSVYSQENKNKIAAIESQREIELRDKQIQINGLALKSEKRTRIALIAGALLLLIIGALLYYQNRTRRKTNITLLTLNNELDEANKVKTKFFSILSHDLRSPITNLVNFLHLQKEAPGLFTPEQTEKHRQQLTGSAENLLDTMEAMLLWSKSQMERFSPQKKLIPVDDLFSYVQKQLPESNIRFIFSNTEKLSVSSDEDYLKTIMYNLTANAIKALAKTNDPFIEWKAVMADNKVALSITDNGAGIHQEQLDALYNKNAVVGTRHGLGLHLIRDLAEAINCRITVKSDAGQGTSFLLQV